MTTGLDTSHSPKRIETRRGTITLPTFFPVTTFGDKYPVDRLIRPYLPRLVQAVLVSHHYAKPLREAPGDRPAIPLFIDSGGFALLFEGSRWEMRGETGVIITASGDTVTPQDVLQQQMDLAEIGATVDFPIPPGLDQAEARRRQSATIANAKWALWNSQRPDLRIFASLQCWDAESARNAAQIYSETAFHDRRFAGIAIGGLVPRIRDEPYLQSVIEAVRSAWAGPIHVFGIGNPTMVRKAIEWGADSTDSSSYVKYAAEGKHFSARIPDLPPAQRTPLGIMDRALRNVAHLLDPTNDLLPLAAVARQAADGAPRG